MSLPAPYYQDDFCTIYNGDSLELFPLLQADVMVTDPPYGMKYSGGMVAKNKQWREVQKSCSAWDQDTSAREKIIGAWIGRPALVFGTWKVQRLECDALLIWHKTDCGYGPQPPGPWANTHEEIYVLNSSDFIGKRGGSVMQCPPPSPGGRDHPTQKPVALMRELISKCPPGIIIDPFMGSGSTLRAAKDLGRKCIGIELDERWCKVAAARLSQENLFHEGAGQ